MKFLPLFVIYAPLGNTPSNAAGKAHKNHSEYATERRPAPLSNGFRLRYWLFHGKPQSHKQALRSEKTHEKSFYGAAAAGYFKSGGLCKGQ